MANTLITYDRGTTYSIGITYESSNGIHGQTALLTVKPVQYDTDAADNTAIVKKDATVSPGSPDTAGFTIAPGDIADTVAPGVYFYDVKVLDTSGAIYLLVSGIFNLVGTPTNRLT